MTETLTKTLTFRPIDISDVTTDLLMEIGKMHLEYFKDSKDASLTIPQVLDVVRTVVTDPSVGFQFWLLLDEEKLVGFAITELHPGVKGLELHLSQAYIAPGHRESSTQKLTIEAFEKYARSRGCAYITSCTRREPQAAYERWMGRVGFKKRWIVMEKDLRGS